MSWLSDTWNKVGGGTIEDIWGAAADPFGVWSGGGGVAGLFGGIGGLGGKSADQNFQESFARNQAAWAPFRKEQAQSLQNQQQQLMQALAAIQSGYGKARGQVGDIFAGQKTAASDAATRTAANVSQNLAQRGLAGTTYAGNLQRGVEADRQRALQNIAGQEAGVYAQLFPQQAAAEANIYGALSNIFGQDINRSLQTYLTQFEHTDASAQTSPLWQLGGAALGGWLGGPAGAGIGASIGQQLGQGWNS